MDQSQDLVTTNYVYPEFVGESYNVRFNESHKWYFASNQQVDEVWVFKCVDTTTDDSIAKGEFFGPRNKIGS